VKFKKNGERTYPREFWTSIAAVHEGLAEKLAAALNACQEDDGYKNISQPGTRDQKTDLALVTLVSAIADIELESIKFQYACLSLAESSRRGRPSVKAMQPRTTSNKLVSAALNVPYVPSKKQGRSIKSGVDGDKWTYRVVFSRMTVLESQGKAHTATAAIQSLIDEMASDGNLSAIRLRKSKFNSIKSSYARGKKKAS
jgi:hypothetical protein